MSLIKYNAGVAIDLALQLYRNSWIYTCELSSRVV